jgi:transposase-like protein
MQETEEKIGTDPIKSIYKDLGLEGEGIKYEAFESTFKRNPKARESIYNDLGFKDAGITFETFEDKLGFRKQPQPGFQYSKPFDTQGAEVESNLLTPTVKVAPSEEELGFRKVTPAPTIQPTTPVIKIDNQVEFGNRLAKEQHEEKIGASYKNLIPQMLQEIPKSVYTTIGNALKSEINSLNVNDEKVKHTGDLSDSLGEQYLQKVFGFLGDNINTADALNMTTPAVAFATIAEKIKGASISQEDKDHAIQELSKASTAIDGRIKAMDEWQHQNPVPENVLTNTAKGISGMLPDIAIAGLGTGSTGAVAQKYVAGLTERGPELIAKYAPKAAVLLERSVTAPFTKVLTAKGALEGGALNTEDPSLGVLEGSLRGAGEGMYMHLLGEGAGRISPYLSKLIGKSGAPSELSTALANPLANAGVFTVAKAIRTPIEEGRLATADELAHEAAMGVGFSLLHAGSLYKTHSEANKYYNDVLKSDPKQSLARVLNDNLEMVRENYKPDLDVKSLEEARDEIKKAIITNPNVQEKSVLGREAINIQNQLDAKDAIDGIIHNKSSLLSVVDASGLAPEVTTEMKAKIESLHKEFNPDEVLKTEVSNKITQNQEKVKKLKETVSEDPIKNAENEIELDAARDEIKSDSDKLKAILINGRTRIADLTPGEPFYTQDGTIYHSSGRDLATATIYTETGKGIPFSEVDIERTFKNLTREPGVEQVPGKETIVETVIPAEGKIDVTIPVDKNPKPEKAGGLRPVERTPKARIESVSENIVDVKDPVPDVTVPNEVLSAREVDRIIRSNNPTTPESDLNKKQGYQAVLKKKFQDLYKVSPEELDTKVKEFVGAVHDYRGKGRIKSEKVYTEKGTKEPFNGLNYWLESAEGLYRKVSGKSKSASQLEIARMRSDLAKGKLNLEIPVAPESIIVEAKKAKAPKKVKENLFKEAIDELSPDNIVSDKVQAEEVPEYLANDQYAQVGYNTKGKTLFVLRDHVADYEKYTEAIEKKLKRIADSDYPEGSNEKVERTIINQLKLRLKDLEVKPTAFKTQTSESAKQAGVLDKIELELNKIDQKNTNSKAREYVDKVQPIVSKLFPGIKFEIFETTAEYTEKTGRPALSAGSFNRKNRSIALNLELIGNRGAESTVYHEAIHPIVDAIFFNNPKALSKAIDKIRELRDEPGYSELLDHANIYRDRGKETMQIEAVTEFLTKSVDGTIDYTKISKSGITKVKEIFNQLFDLLGIPRKFSTGDDISKLATELKNAFELGEVSSLKTTIGGKNIKNLYGKYDRILDNILPDKIVEISKIVSSELRSTKLKSTTGLDKALIKLVKDGKISVSDVSRITDIEKKNLLKLVKAEQDRLTSGKSAGELMKDRHYQTEAEVKKLDRDKGLLSKKSIDAARQKLWDFDGRLIKTLKKDGAFVPTKSTSITETYGERAERLLKTIPAAYSKADAAYREAMSKVYGSGWFGEGKIKSLTKGEQKLMSDIALYKRVIELDSQRLRDGVELMQHPGNLDIAQSNQKLEELASHDPSIVAEYGEYNFNKLEGRVNEYYKVLQSLVDYRFSNGLISKAAYDKLKSIKYYSPRVFLKHLVEDGFYSNKPTIQKTIKSINDGSQGEIITNLSKIMADAINVTYEVAARNTSTKAIADIIEANPDVTWGKTASYTTDFLKRLKENQDADENSSPAITGSDIVRVDEVSKYKYIEPSFNPAPAGYQLKIYRDGGVKRGFYVKSELSREIDGLRVDANKWLVRASLAPTVRTLATATNWWFSLTNPWRDAQYALFTTDHYSNHLPVAAVQYTGDFVTSIKDAFMKSGSYKKYVSQGGGSEYLHSDAKLSSGGESTLKRDLDVVWDLIAHRLPSTFEYAGRLAVRKRAIKNLEDKANKDGVEMTAELRKNIEEQASFSALQVLNFSEGGETTKQINQFVPFFNVGIIASRNLVRYAKSDPKVFAYKAAQLAGFSVALAALNNGLLGDDPISKETGEFYRNNISEHDKASNFIVMTKMRYINDDGNLQYMYIKIPRSQDQMLLSGLAEYGAMSAAGVEGYTKEKYTKHRAFKDLRGLISYLPDGGNLLPPVIKSGIGYVTDFDFFREEHFTKSEEMANRKPEDQYDLTVAERWKTIARAPELFGGESLSPIKLRGAFKSTIPTSNQWFDAADYVYTKAFGEDTKAVAIANEANGSPWDRFEKQMSDAGATEEQKREMYKELALGVIPKIPGISRLIKLTSPTVIDIDRDEAIAQDASDSFHDVEAVKEAAYRFKKGNVTREELLGVAKNSSKDPLIIKRAIGLAVAAIKLKKGTNNAYDVLFSGVQSNEGKAKLLWEKVSSMSPEDGATLQDEIRNTGLFRGTFWVEYKRLQKENNK